MNCVTPTIDLPDTFRTDGVDEIRSGIKQRGISTDESRPKTSIDDDQSLEIYIGFRLDGLAAYKNLSDTKALLCCDAITFHEALPVVSEVQTFGEHVPGQSIRIKVR
jgi:hypothetical protein